MLASLSNPPARIGATETEERTMLAIPRFPAGATSTVLERRSADHEQTPHMHENEHGAVFIVTMLVSDGGERRSSRWTDAVFEGGYHSRDAGQTAQGRSSGK